MCEIFMQITLFMSRHDQYYNKLNIFWMCTILCNTTTVEPPIMNSPNSEKSLIMKLFVCAISTLFHRFVPLNKENLQMMKKTQFFHYSEVPQYMCKEKS